MPYYNAGIYVIMNIKTGDLYVGQTSFMVSREIEHFALLKAGHHAPKLQKQYDEYGRNALWFHPVLYCEDFELTRYEALIIQLLKPTLNTQSVRIPPPYHEPFEQSKRPAQPEPEPTP